VPLFTSGSDQPFVLGKYKQAFTELTHAEEFDYRCMNWGDAEVTQFAMVLTECKELKELKLRDNRIGDSGAAKLAEALPHMTSLQTLSLHGNKIGDKGAERISEALRHMTSLTYLSMRQRNSWGCIAAMSKAGKHKLRTAAEALPNLRIDI